MVDIRIRKNERCIIGLPICDYVFSSTRSCFIAYGFSTSGLERDISLFSLIRNTTIANLQNHPDEQALALLGFNVLTKFDGLSGVYLGNFSALSAHQIIWRVGKLLEMIEARRKAAQTRIPLGSGAAIGQSSTRTLEIWLIVKGQNEEAEISKWLRTNIVSFPWEIFTLSNVQEIVSQLP